MCTEKDPMSVWCLSETIETRMMVIEERMMVIEERIVVIETRIEKYSVCERSVLIACMSEVQ